MKVSLNGAGGGCVSAVSDFGFLGVKSASSSGSEMLRRLWKSPAALMEPELGELWKEGLVSSKSKLTCNSCNVDVSLQEKILSLKGEPTRHSKRTEIWLSRFLQK
jgi:hypothetical protein